MSAEDLLKEEEITLTYKTWTFDPSVLTQDPNEEEFLRFPEEVEELFYAEGFSIFAKNMELFEATEINGVSAYISDGIRPVAVVMDCEDDYDEELVVCNLVAPGGKVLFADEGYLIFVQKEDCFVRPLESK